MADDYLKRDFDKTMDVLRNSVVGHRYDREMRKVTEEYKREMLEWYTKGRAVTENPMKRATQEHWYSLYLEKKRLERHSCKVEYASYDQIAYPAEELTKTNLL